MAVNQKLILLYNQNQLIILSMIIFNVFTFLVIFIFNYFYFMNRDDQFKAPKRKVSARRLRIESHPTDIHKGINCVLYIYID